MWRRTLNDYEVSYDGKIRNANTGREIKQFVGSDGYMRTQIAGKTRLVHRVIARAYIPEEPGKLFINHKDGNKQNNSVDNLEWCTRSENMYHAYTNELKPRPVGIKNGRCRLSNDQVKFIRDHYIPGDETYGATALSKRFGVARQTISAINSGQNWKGENNERTS